MLITFLIIMEILLAVGVGVSKHLSGMAKESLVYKEKLLRLAEKEDKPYLMDEVSTAKMICRLFVFCIYSFSIQMLLTGYEIISLC